MSPLEFHRELEAYDENNREVALRTIATAWYTVALDHDLRVSGLKSLGHYIEKYAPRTRPEAVKKPKPSDIAGQLKWLGIQQKPMSEATKAAMWKPKVPVKADG